MEINHHNLRPDPEGIKTFRGLLIALLFSATFWLIVLTFGVIIIICSACATIQPSPALSIELTRVVVHLTEDRSTWLESTRRAEVAGCASSDNQIWMRRGEFTNPDGGTK